MRYLIIIFLLSSLSSFAQEPTYTRMYSNYQYRGIRVDSLFLLPKFSDTGSAPNSLKNIHGNLIRVNKKFYYRDTALTKWTELGGGGTSTDTTSLSNRIEQRVPYTGATDDVDLGTFNLSAHELKIEGTNGQGKLDLRKQSSNSTTSANSSALFADANGNLSWQNDNIRYFKLNNDHFTADHFFRLPDTTGTLALLQNVDTKLNISDTSTMLSPYLRAVDTASLSNRIDTINLQYVTDNNNTTTNTILAQSIGVYDATLDFYGTMLMDDDEFRFDGSNGPAILFKYNYLKLLNTSTFSGEVNVTTLTNDRTYTMPDSSGTVALLSNVNAKVNISDTASMLAGYIRSSIFPIATFGGGSGAAGDTSVFTTDAIYGSFYNAGTDSIVVTSIDTVQRSGSVTTTVYYNTSINTSGATTVTAGSTIPPARHVWVQTTAITTKPTYYSVTLNGYRKRP